MTSPAQRKRRTKKKAHGRKRPRANRVLKNSRKHRRVRRKKVIRASSRKAITDPRVARAMGLMRREGVSASVAARREKMKLKTFRQRAGRYLYRSGPGKPWKARSEDQLSFSMTVLTSRGPAEVIVRNSRERKLLHEYELALRMFRAGEDGAEAALKAFKGKRVGGHALITDIKLLIELEEAGQLDFDAFYTSIGPRP
jgi:alkylated DNA nucleotide flippase Atl1